MASGLQRRLDTFLVHLLSLVRTCEPVHEFYRGIDVANAIGVGQHTAEEQHLSDLVQIIRIGIDLSDSRQKGGEFPLGGRASKRTHS